MSKTPSRQPTPNPQYTIQIDLCAKKTLRRQALTVKERLVKAILVPADNPHPPNLRKLELAALHSLEVVSAGKCDAGFSDCLAILAVSINSREITSLYQFVEDR